MDVLFFLRLRAREKKTVIYPIVPSAGYSEVLSDGGGNGSPSRPRQGHSDPFGVTQALDSLQGEPDREMYDCVRVQHTTKRKAPLGQQ